MKKLSVLLTLLLTLSLAAVGCGSSASSSSDSSESTEKVTLTLAAAASLEKAFTEELIPMFEKENENVTVEGTYDSSGKLQTQIENGLEADVFMSAATTQMDALVDEEYVTKDDVVDLLENKLVLIKAKDASTSVTGFEDITNADMIAIGDPESVPAGQYAKEAFENIGNYDDVSGKASFGTNVTEVLSWVESGSAEVGVVYASDAATSDKVEVIATADEYLETPVIYPVAKLTKSQDAAADFITFLQTDEALAVFEKYGFSINK
jgi:molybdate transport system substrate-binding protein